MSDDAGLPDPRCPVHGLRAVPDDRWTELRATLTQDAATDQELGDDYAEMGTDEALETAHRHWGRAKVLREVLAYMDREDQQ